MLDPHARATVLEDVLLVLHTTQNGTNDLPGRPDRVASFRSLRYPHRSQFRTFARRCGTSTALSAASSSRDERSV